jgi:signal-transduction protein with cAMP-binding, CBS, and nucleotidyltransferase domain
MRTIGEILASKARAGTVTVEASASILEAVRQMDRANTGSVVVLEGRQVVGIFTERDLMRRVVLKGLDLENTPVSAVMTRDLIYAEPNDPAEEAMAKMTHHRCRHLPVVEAGTLLGVVSIGDLMKELTEQQEVEIQFLKEYIYSR